MTKEEKISRAGTIIYCEVFKLNSDGGRREDGVEQMIRMAKLFDPFFENWELCYDTDYGYYIGGIVPVFKKEDIG